MGTAIVSVGLSTDDRHTLSRVLLAIAAAVWVALGLLLAARLLRDRARFSREAGSPAALTGVAATAVLGARATGLGWSGIAAALLVIATCTWLALFWPVLRGWTSKLTGVAFMTTVSTQSLAVLAAQLALRDHAAWLLYVSIGPFVLGMALYVFVLASFDLRQLLEGRGDHWVSGGALAITALAAARISIGAHQLHLLVAVAGGLRTLSLVMWALALAWLPALLAAEAIRPRPRYDVRRWATVFPVGMYAACSFDAGQAAGVQGLVDFARVWVWIGFGLWAVTFAAMLWHSRTLVAGERPATESRRVEEVAPSEAER
jgi:tellurite resistance protein TehA-like permease